MGAVLCIDWLPEFFVLAGLVQDGLPVALCESPGVHDSVGKSAERLLQAGHAARVRRARWETRVEPSGVPFSQASTRVKLRAVAERMFARWVLLWPR